MSNSQIAARENELFELVSLKGRENEAVRRYSKGMRQRLGLAQAMLHDPDLLILDEPTDGLDPMGRSQIRDVLEKLKNRGKTVFLNSHILQEVELICDRVAIMALGKLRGIGTIDGLIRSHTQENAAALVLEVISSPSSIEQLHILPEHASLEPIVFESLVEQTSASPELQSSAEHNLSRISIPSIDQAGADRLVDALRANNISILRIERARPSLEQVFMNIVGAAT
jgi:ABC-2 type transport system ATP-binding protein